jgi:hypothetical protein
MLLFIRWLRSGRGGRLARGGALLLLLILIALLAARVAVGGWSGVGAVPAFVIVAVIGWRLAMVARRRRAWPTRDADPGAPGNTDSGVPGNTEDTASNLQRDDRSCRTSGRPYARSDQ